MRSEAPYRLNLCKNNPTVRDARWSIYIEERSDSGPTCGLQIGHRIHGDPTFWPESAQESLVGQIVYDHAWEKEFPTTGPAMKAALRFLRRFGAGEVEWLEWDIDGQRNVVVQHTPRERMTDWYDVREDRPDPLAGYFPDPPAEEPGIRERIDAEAQRLYQERGLPVSWNDLGEALRVEWRRQAQSSLEKDG